MIFDTINNRLISANFALVSAAVETLSIRIDCVTGYSLSLASGADADLIIEAKQSAALTYTNIELTPIDLGTWNGTRQTFIIRITAPTVTGISRKNLNFKVSR